VNNKIEIKYELSNLAGNLILTGGIAAMYFIMFMS